MTDEFIREVDEDLRQERSIKLWQRFMPYILSISLGIILFTTSYVVWDNYSKKSKQKLGDAFTAAVELAKEDDIDAALIALDKIVDKGSDGYVTMAKMKKASLLIELGKLEDGLKIYLDLEKNAFDQSFRDIATILYVMNSLDTQDPDLLLEKILPLEASNIWKSSALELKAFIFLRKKDTKLAIQIFQEILDMKSKPSSLSSRSKNMIDFLKER
tara:strand:+ start:1128 stop:1772 length:645 start_codon:yes stop_codon:yes gene_type:complete